MKSLVKPLTMTLVTILLVTACQAVGTSPEAAMYRGGPRRTGLYDTEGLSELTGVKWKFKTEGEVWSSPVVAAGTVYFGSDDDHLYAIDVKAGQEKWKFKTEGDVRSSPAIASGTVFFSSFDGYLYAVDAKTGQEQWKLSTLTIPQADVGRNPYDEYLSSPLVVDGVVYIGSLLDGNHCFYAVDAKTGQEKWSFKATTLEIVRSSPAVSGDMVYFGGDFGHLYALDVHTGEQKWKFKTGATVNYAPAVGDDGTVYFGSKDTYIYALDGQTGEQKWRVNPAGSSWVTSSPAIAEGMLYAGSSVGFGLHAVEMATGEEKWTFPTRGYVWSSPAVVDGIAYIGSGNGSIYAIDLQTRQEAWSFETGNAVYASPIVADGVVYIGSLDGHLYALN